jgi:hypothetical protein
MSSLHFEEGFTAEQELQHIEWCKRRMVHANKLIADYTSRLDDESLSKEQQDKLRCAIVEWRLDYNRCYSSLPDRFTEES